MKQTKLFGNDYKPELQVLSKLDIVNSQALALRVQGAISPLCDRFQLVGSIRRKKASVGDIDFVIIATDENWGKLVKSLKIPKAICAGPSVIKANFPYEDKLFQVDFYRATEQTFGIQMLIRTGSADHNMFLASHAISMGFRLKYSEGLLKDEEVIAGHTEDSVFEALGLLCPKPEEREIVNGKPIWLKN
jgi:DNA polymerase (family X)